MKKGLLNGIKSGGTLFLWLMLSQFISSLLLGIVALIGWIIHPMGSTPLWEYIGCSVIFCAFWFYMGWRTPYADQLKPGVAVPVIAVWTVMTFLMEGTLLFFSPQPQCGAVIREIFEAVNYESRFWFYEFWDTVIGYVMLSTALGVGLFRKQKKLKENPVTNEENA